MPKKTLATRKKLNTVLAIEKHVIKNIRHKSSTGYIIFLMRNFAINNRYLYDRMSFIKKNTVINKIVPDFMDTLYVCIFI